VLEVGQGLVTPCLWSTHSQLTHTRGCTRGLSCLRHYCGTLVMAVTQQHVRLMVMAVTRRYIRLTHSISLRISKVIGDWASARAALRATRHGVLEMQRYARLHHFLRMDDLGHCRPYLQPTRVADCIIGLHGMLRWVPQFSIDELTIH